MKDTIKAVWNSFWSLDLIWRRFALAGTAVVFAMTVMFWRVMVPISLLVALIAAYLRHSRGKDSL